MTKETKIGLLVGMGVIILIGILISDHLSVAQRQQQAQLANGIPEIHEDMIPPAPHAVRELPAAQATRRTEPMPLPDEIPPVVTRSNAPPANTTVPAAVPQPPVAVAEARPHTIVQDVNLLMPDRQTHGQYVPVPPANVQGYGAIPSDPGAGAGLPPELFEKPMPPTPRPPSVPASKAIVHYVGKEETLSDISRKYYGTAGQWKDIYEANRSVIPNPNLVRPGVRLVIPPKPGTASANMTAAAVSGGSDNTGTAIRITAERPAKPAAPAMKTYTVKQGDTLSSIADRFTGSAANWQKLYAANKSVIKDPDRVPEGTVLQIPAN